MLEQASPSAAAGGRTVVERFARAAALWPERCALSCGDDFVSFRELRARAAARARRLRALGCGPETLVAVCLERSPELVVSLLGALECGAAFLPLDPQFPPERLKTLVQRSGARAVVTQRPYAALFEGGAAAVLSVDVARETGDGHGAAFPAPEPLSLAYVIYTSGSTGVPKGVAVSHASFQHYLSWALAHYRFRSGGVSLACTSIGFDLTLTSLFCPLLAGMRVVLVPDADGLDGVLRVLDAGREDVALLKLTPSHLALMAEATSGRRPAWDCDVLIVGGEQLTQESLRFWQARAPSTRIFNEYGPTEATVGCCVAQVSARPGPANAPAPIGAAIEGVELRVSRPADPGAGDEAEGEMFIGGASLARGYLDAPAATAEKFVPDPAGRGARLYRTGDWVRRDEGGAGLVYAGRRDRQHKVKGVRIELGEIEAALAQYPGARGAAVVLLQERDGGGEAGLLAFLALAEPERAGVELSALVRFLKGRVLSAALPREYYLVSRLPVAVSGKVDHERLLRERASYLRVADRFVAPRNPAEELLASLWRGVLACDEIGIDDSFFALDGNSMKSIQFVYEAKKHGLTLTTRDLFERHTIRRLAELVAQGPSAAAAPAALPGPLELLDARDRERVPADVEDAYPLALLQAGTLFESGRRPESGTYHNVNSYHLECRLDPELLRRSLELVAARHPILRTSFDFVSFREPLQLVHRRARIPLLTGDISALSPEEQDAFVIDFIEQESRRAFDWTQPPLLRFFLHDRGRGRVQFTLSKHHSILDGWSAATLIAEIVRNCLALARGEEAPFQVPVASTYRDFVALERLALGSEEARAFWSAHLSGARHEALRPWPGEKPQADGGCTSATARVVTLGPELSARLKVLATRAHVPLKSVLLAAHLRVLAQLFGSRDVVTGVVSHGRPETTDADKAIGLFINTVPYRQALDGRVTWFELARRAFEQEQRVFPHQRYPMARLRRELAWERLFESIFYYTNFHVFRDFRDSPELRCVSSSGFEETEIPFTAAFSLHPLTSDIGLKLHFHVEHFSRAQIETVTGWFAEALARCADAPDEPALAPHERRAPARPARAAAAATQAASVFDLFRERARARPDAVALASGERRVTYGALLRRAEGLAAALAARGVGPGEVVGIGTAALGDALAAMLAANRAQAAFVVLDPQWPDERVTEVLAQLRPAALILDGEWSARSPAQGYPRLGLDAGDAHAGGPPSPAAADPDGLAYIVFTSGSTGRPKGVMVTQRGLLRSTLARLRYFADRPYEHFLLLSRLTFDSAYAGLWGTLCGGGTLHLIDEQRVLDVGLVAGLMADEGVTHTLCVPSLYRVLLPELRDGGSSALSTVIVAGEEAPRDLVQAHRSKLPGVALFNEYGPSEVTVWATVAELTAEAGERTGAGLSIGTALEHVDAWVLDARLDPLGPGARGELYLGGPAVARGYHAAPALTAERFVPNPHAAGPDDPPVLYRTGDLVRQSPEGEFEFVGRADNQVKVRGFRIEPEEVERAFHEAFTAREALVRVREDAPGRKRICLYYVPAVEGGGLATHAVRAALGRRLPAYTLPDEVFEVEALAHLPNGKLDRGAEPTVRATAAPAPAEDRPASEIEQALLGIWREALGREDVGVGQSFFEIGGDSLLANQVVLRADRVFGVKLPLKEFYEAPTVAAHAALFKDKGAAAGLDFERVAAVWNRLDAAS